MSWNGVMRSNRRKLTAFSPSADIFFVCKRIKLKKLIAKVRYPECTACYKRIRVMRYERIAGFGKL